jgi:predicted dehydrogenase
MKKTKVAIIGTGSISYYHTIAYKNLPNVEIVAACDINKDRVTKFAEVHNIPHTFTDYNEMLKLNEIDAVSVTAWNNIHAPASIAALKAGKHVLCEKPLALNTAEAKEMLEVSKSQNKLLMVGFVRRFGANTIALKEMINKNQLGEIYYAKAGCIRRWGNPGGWFSDKKRSGGGPVIDLGVHMIDLVRYLSGKPKAVSVSASTFYNIGMKPDTKGVTKYCAIDYDTFNDVESSAVALIRFDNDMTLSFETSWVQNVKQDSLYLQLYGSKSGAQMEPELELYEDRNGFLANTTPIIDPNSYHFEHNFMEEIKHFIDCVENGTDCINTAEDGLEIMKILDAIYESAKLKREVIINN